MIPKERDIERLTDAQVSDLLDMALTTELGVELERLSSLPSGGLVREVRAILEQNDLGLRESARLLAVNELTLKSWLDASKTLPEPAQQKLAAICVLLRIATAPGADQEIAPLVARAMAFAKRPSVQQISLAQDRIHATAATFGPSGLMAAALYLALRQ